MPTEEFSDIYYVFALDDSTVGVVDDGLRMMTFEALLPLFNQDCIKLVHLIIMVETCWSISALISDQ